MNTFDINKYTARMRPETASMIRYCEGKNIELAVFLSQYKGLGISKTSPAKGKNIYKFLKKVGYIK